MSRQRRARVALTAGELLPAFATFDGTDPLEEERLERLEESVLLPPSERARAEQTVRELLTEGDRAKEGRLQGLIDALLVHLGMDHWQVKGKFHPVNSEFRALIRIDRYFRQATIYLVDEEPEADWDLAVCHELIHLILDPLSVLVDSCLQHVDSRREAELLTGQVVEIEEPLVNRLTEIIIGRPWPQTRTQEVA